MGINADRIRRGEDIRGRLASVEAKVDKIQSDVTTIKTNTTPSGA